MVEEYYELFFKFSFVFLLAGISDYFREKVELECNCNPNEELEKFKEEIVTSVREEVRALVENK